ncbi:MAG: arginyltransferase [Magnetococcales bacterium]|nr:arginyltransferase [Magnetococcales bacterium]
MQGDDLFRQVPEETTLLLSPLHECGYFPERPAATLFLPPGFPLDAGLFRDFLTRGFRRSGKHVYRPSCPECERCLPVRLPVAAFVRSRSLARVWRRNRDLEVREIEGSDDPETFALYRRYLAVRHGGGPMADPDPGSMVEHLTCSWGVTRFVEFRLEGRLVMVAVIDKVPGALSSVYTFFDPGEQSRSLGTYGILWSIEAARQRGDRWLYLGYWIPQSPKMRYKARFQPLEGYWQGEWVPLASAKSRLPGSMD